MFAVIGALAGLEKARSTGSAQHIDVSMLDGQISMLSYQAVFYLISGQVPGPRGTGHPSFPIAQSFVCADGQEVHVSAISERMWPALCTAIEREDLLTDARFAESAGRRTNKAALLQELAEVFRSRPATYWLAVLNASGVPAAPVNTLDRMAADPQVHHRQMLVDMDYDGHQFTTVGNPIKVRGQAQTYTPPPRLGEHTGQVLAQRLGLTADELHDLAQAGVIDLAPVRV
jgi:crotonobetainyl-CoA:carnitine CoA-transferase CaiB-like acyl-CoA transferase